MLGSLALAQLTIIYAAVLPVIANSILFWVSAKNICVALSLLS